MRRRYALPFDKLGKGLTVFPVSEEKRAILFYDGDCGLCSRSVRFMMERDRASVLFYAPLQGKHAAELLAPELRESLSTVIYRNTDGVIRLRSDAVLHALIDIGSGWRFLARPALFIPQGWRDGIYRWVAARRHKFFPKESCALPTPEESRQLLA